MNHLFEILIHWAGSFSDPVGTCLSLLSNGGAFLTNGGALLAAGGALLSPASALVGEPAKMQESFRAAARRWHGNIGERFANIDHLVRVAEEHQKEWKMPDDLFDTLIDLRDQLEIIVPHCLSGDVRPTDRAERDRLLANGVYLCRNPVKEWAYGKLADGTMTVDDIHSLCLFAPGDIGGHRTRTSETNELAKLAVQVIGSDMVRIVFTHSAGKNAVGATHGWPTGVRYALIVIRAVADRSEVIRRITTRRYNTIAMPQGSHGKHFLVQVALLKHVEDTPRFGPQQTFTLPLSTEEIFQSRVEKESNEMEEMRRKMERMAAELEVLRRK
jgi:hypothetical protein